MRVCCVRLIGGGDDGDAVVWLLMLCVCLCEFAAMLCGVGVGVGVRVRSIVFIVLLLCVHIGTNELPASGMAHTIGGWADTNASCYKILLSIAARSIPFSALPLI